MEGQSGKAVIKIKPDGSLHIKGKFVIRDEKGNVLLSAEEAFLCRCGKTSKPPFCDGSHRKP
jgi:CDGSH iron-sulfur domain-containing protein 3